MLNNNIIPKKELVDPNKRKMRKKLNLRKKLRIVEEASNEESDDSKMGTFRTLPREERSPKRGFKNRLE